VQVNDDDGLPTYIAAVVAVRRKCIGTSMTAQLSEYATSGPMAGDENGGGSSSNDSGGGDESTAERRVVMIAFKMENDCDGETAAGPSRDDSNSEPHAMMLQQQQSPPPSFSSDGNTAGKTAYIFLSYYNVIYVYNNMLRSRSRKFSSVVEKQRVRDGLGVTGRPGHVFPGRGGRAE